MRLDDLKLPDLAPYLKGEADYRWDEYTPLSITSSDLLLWTDLFNSQEEAPVALQKCEQITDFLTMCPIFKKEVEKDKLIEMFYSFKNGFNSDVPAQVLYYIKKAYDTYGLPNVIPKVLPVKILRAACDTAYMNGHNFVECVHQFCTQDYIPIEHGKYVVPFGDFLEVYYKDGDYTRIVRKGEYDLDGTDINVSAYLETLIKGKMCTLCQP